MQAWLREQPLPLPQVVDEAPEEAQPTHGLLSLPAGQEAAVLLQGQDGELLRLSWEQREGAAASTDRRRALPVGSYRIRGVRIVDRSREGEVWHTSASGHRLGHLEVEAGQLQALELDPTVQLSKSLRRGRAAMSINRPGGAGLSIYKDGRRVPIGYRLVDAAGRAVASGRMRYG